MHAHWILLILTAKHHRLPNSVPGGKSYSTECPPFSIILIYPVTSRKTKNFHYPWNILRRVIDISTCSMLLKILWIITLLGWTIHFIISERSVVEPSLILIVPYVSNTFPESIILREEFCLFTISHPVGSIAVVSKFSILIPIRNARFEKSPYPLCQNSTFSLILYSFLRLNCGSKRLFFSINTSALSSTLLPPLSHQFIY